MQLQTLSVPAYFDCLNSVVQVLVKSPSACLLYSGRNSIVHVSAPVLQPKIPLSRPGTCCRDCILRDAWPWSLWPSTCYAGFLLPFLGVSILATSGLSLPGAPLVCLTAGQSPAASVVTNIMLVVGVATSCLVISLYHDKAPFAMNIAIFSVGLFAFLLASIVLRPPHRLHQDFRRSTGSCVLRFSFDGSEINCFSADPRARPPLKLPLFALWVNKHTQTKTR